jgi:hypothetical protein
VRGKPLSPAQREEKLRATLTEFYSTRDEAEATLSVSELGAEAPIAFLVQTCAEKVLEGKQNDVDVCNKFLVALHREKLLPADAVGSAFTVAFEFLDDVAIDSPFAPKLAAAFAGALLECGALARRRLPRRCSRASRRPRRQGGVGRARRHCRPCAGARSVRRVGRRRAAGARREARRF